MRQDTEGSEGYGSVQPSPPVGPESPVMEGPLCPPFHPAPSIMSAHSQGLMNKCGVGELCPPGCRKGKKVWSGAPESSSGQGTREIQGHLGTGLTLTVCQDDP